MPFFVPAAVLLGEGQRGDRLAGGDARQEVLLRRVVARVQQRLTGEDDGGEVGRAQEGPAHLFEHHDQLDEAVARAAELLGDDQALQAELLAHLRPHGRVVARSVSICSRTADLRRLGFEELPHDPA